MVESPLLTSVLLAMQVNLRGFFVFVWSGSLVSERQIQARLVGQKLVIKNTLRKQNVKPCRKKVEEEQRMVGGFS